MSFIKIIALLGFGVVGSGVVELVHRNKKENFMKYNEEISIGKILVREKEKYKNSPYYDLVTDSFEEILSLNPDVVVEVMGGLQPSYTYVRELLSRKIAVVTANKDLIAEFGEELINFSIQKDTPLKYEASVGGGIPVLRSVEESLIGNRIDWIVGILNGTTNFILTKMNDEGMNYGDALKMAQDMGFAEANPESDVKGLDASRKLSIISSLAYDRNISWQSIPVEGITEVDKQDMEYARLFNCKLKLLAYSCIRNDRVYAAVRPALVRTDSALAKFDNEYNVIKVHGDAVGELMFSGKGAGKLPTASAVYGDVLSIFNGKRTMQEYRFKELESAQPHWPLKAKWLLRIATPSRKQLLTTLFRIFSSFPVEVINSQGSDLLAMVESPNEQVLVNKLNELRIHPSVDSVKYLFYFDEENFQPIGRRN